MHAVLPLIMFWSKSERRGKKKVVVDATRNLLMYNLIAAAATVAAVPNLFTWQRSFGRKSRQAYY